MALLIPAAMGAGYLISSLLLSLGVTKMLLRFPVAWLVSWAAYILLLREWARFETKSFRLEEDVLEELEKPCSFSALDLLRWIVWPLLGAGAYSSRYGLGDLFNAVFLIVMLVGPPLALAALVVDAPTLISDAAFEDSLSPTLAARVDPLGRQPWLKVIVAQTATPAFFMGILFMGFALVFSIATPKAKTAAEAWKGTERARGFLVKRIFGKTQKSPHDQAERPELRHLQIEASARPDAGVQTISGSTESKKT